MTDKPIMTAEEIGQHVLNVCEHQQTQAAHHGIADALATSVGGLGHMSGASLEDTLEYFDALSVMMRKHIATNWGTVEIANAP